MTKIVAVKNVTAIWEYDPTQDDNHVLGGTLDIIVAICTLPIKVSIYAFFQFHSSHEFLSPRSRHPDNVLNIFRAHNFNVDFLKH